MAEQLDPHEISFLQRLNQAHDQQTKLYRVAQDRVAEAIRTRDSIHADLDRATTAYQTFSIYLNERYQMAPGDQIALDGAIVRAKPVAAASDATALPETAMVDSAPNTIPSPAEVPDPTSPTADPINPNDASSDVASMPEPAEETPA